MSRPRGVRLLVAAVALPFLLASCAQNAQTVTADKELARQKIPQKVSPDTEITVGAPELKVALQLSGQLDDIPFKVEWAELSGGPECSEAFRADSLDLCSAAEIPSINAHWTNLDTKLVASEVHRDPQRFPLYELGIAPGVHIEKLSDLKGKKIAYSPGQAQGALVLRILHKAGLRKKDVELVELASTADVYPTSLGNHQVDAAPLADVNIRRYLGKYGRHGGKTIKHGLRDDATHLWAPTKSVSDPQKSAAIREIVKLWARAQRWVDKHPKEWIDGWYVKDQGLTEKDGEFLVRRAGHPEIPASWSGIIRRHQATVDLLAKEQGHEPFKASQLFDRRYESVAAAALAHEGSTP